MRAFIFLVIQLALIVLHLSTTGSQSLMECKSIISAGYDAVLIQGI